MTGCGGLLLVLVARRSPPPVKAAGCCQHVRVFRYADDRSGLTTSASMRVLIVEDEP